MHYIVPKNAIEFLDYRNFDILKKRESKTNSPTVGLRYSLKGKECDGFTMKKKTYEIVGRVDDFHGISVNSFIVKQVSGDDTYKFTLSKNDCANLGIEYEQGLQLFPIEMDWIEERDEIVWNPYDLSTYPSDHDSTIDVAMLKIHGFSDYTDGTIMTPNGKIVKEETFLKSIKVINTVPIVYNKNFHIDEKTIIDAFIVKPNEVLFKYGNYIGEDGCIYLMLNFKRRFVGSMGVFTTNDMAIERKYVKDFNPYETFAVYWDERGQMTIDEYEASKKATSLKSTSTPSNVRNQGIQPKEQQKMFCGFAKELSDMVLNGMMTFDEAISVIDSLPSHHQIYNNDKRRGYGNYVWSI